MSKGIAEEKYSRAEACLNSFTGPYAQQSHQIKLFAIVDDSGGSKISSDVGDDGVYFIGMSNLVKAEAGNEEALHSS